MLDDVEFQIAKLQLGPGDILVVRSARPITAVMASELSAQIARQFDLNRRVMVIDANTDLSILSASELYAITPETPQMSVAASAAAVAGASVASEGHRSPPFSGKQKR